MDSDTCTVPTAPAAAADPTYATADGPPASGAGPEVTLLTKAGGPLTKRISLDATGRVVSDGSACVMAEGRAERLRLAGPAALAAVLGAMAPDQAFALGRLRADLPDEVPVPFATVTFAIAPSIRLQ